MGGTSIRLLAAGLHEVTQTGDGVMIGIAGALLLLRHAIVGIQSAKFVNNCLKSHYQQVSLL